MQAAPEVGEFPASSWNRAGRVEDGKRRGSGTGLKGLPHSQTWQRGTSSLGSLRRSSRQVRQEPGEHRTSAPAKSQLIPSWNGQNTTCLTVLTMQTKPHTKQGPVRLLTARPPTAGWGLLRPWSKPILCSVLTLWVGPVPACGVRGSLMGPAFT